MKWYKRHLPAILIALSSLVLVVLRAMKFADWDWVTISIIFVGVVGIILSLSSAIRSKNVVEEIKAYLKPLIDSQTFELVDNPEWIKVLTDSEKRIIVGIKKDGSVEWYSGVPAPIRKELDELKNEILELKKKLPQPSAVIHHT